MAIFNPDVAPGKDGVPDYTKITKPVSDITADRSTGIALATLGQGLEGASGIIETTAKDIINKDVRTTVENTRADYTDDLLNARAVLEGKDQSLNLLPEGVGPTGPVPAGIDAGLRRVDRIQNMLMTGSGKIAGDDTYYDMRLKNDVVALRSRYPGFVDYIDQRVAQITGMNPANEAVKDLTRQLAQLQTTRKSEYDKTVDMARKAISDGLGNASATMNAKTMYDFLIKGGVGAKDAYLNWYYEENAKRAMLEDKARARQATVGDREDREKQWDSDYRTELSSLISGNMNTLLTVTGMGDPKSLMGFIKDAAENPGKYNDVQLRQFAAYVGAQKTAALAQAQEIATRQQKDGTSYNRIVDSAKLEQARENIISRYYDSITDALTKGNAGLAFQNANRAKALVDVKTDQVYSGPEGENILLLKVIEGAMGSQWAAQVSTASINNNIDTSIRKLFEIETMKGKAGAIPTASNPTGQQPTYKDFADKALTLQQSGRINERMRARYLSEGMDTFINDITDPKAPDPAKQNAIKFFFSPQGQEILKNFRDDYYKDGVFYPGKQTVWNKLSSDEVVKNIKAQSAKDASIGIMYKNWMEKEAGSQLYLKDMLNLNGFVAHNNDIQIKYNDGGGKAPPTITLLNSEGKELSAKDMGPMRTSQAYYKKMVDSVGRVNEALAGMHRVYGAFGGDASDNLLNFLQQSQVDFGRGWTGLPKDITEAIVAARGKGKLKDVLEKAIK